MEEEYGKLLFAIRRSIRYHMRRCRFFDSASRATSGASLIFGSSTLFMLLYDKGPSWLAILPALVGAASIIALVYETPRMARLHSELARRFIELEQKMMLAESPGRIRLAPVQSPEAGHRGRRAAHPPRSGPSCAATK